jgi:hypothetical protein
MMLFCVNGCIEAYHTRKNCCDNLRHIFIIYILYETTIQSFHWSRTKNAEVISGQNADSLQLVLVKLKYH